MRSVRRARLGALALLMGTALMSGCAGMPTSGPVVEQEPTPGAEELPGAYFDPRPPRPGQSPAEVVQGFLEAMRATPIRTSAAREFLSSRAQNLWAPESQILTYEGVGAPLGRTRITMELTDVDKYDARGAWRRSHDSTDLEFSLVEEDGQWRISEAPNALIVPGSWFGDWYEPVSLFYFDPTSQILVPEPVFAPKGDQFASSLVRGLLKPPGGKYAQVYATAFPRTLEPGLSVPISSAGIAEVTLDGDPELIDNAMAQRMLAQLAWTLRQEPSVRAIQLTVGGRSIGGGGGAGEVGLDVGAAFDPAGAEATADLFALEKGRLLSGSVSDLTQTQGPFGATGFRLRSVGVNLSGSQAAGVSHDGQRLWIAPVADPDARPREVPLAAGDLLKPAWDFRDRVWVVAAGPNGARVFVIDGKRQREVQVRGISGRDVVHFLVSRDGSRFVAVIRGRQADRVVSARVRYDGRGRLLGLNAGSVIPLDLSGTKRIKDLGWRTATTWSVLAAITPELHQVLTHSVDGAPMAIASDSSTRLLRGRIRALVTSPAPGRVAMALSKRAVFDLATPENVIPGLPAGVSFLTYVG